MNKSVSKKKAENQIPKNRSQEMPAGVEVTDAGNMDKIRDILFGNQMREYEKRFGRMEEQLFNEITEVRESTLKRLETLETYFKKELSVLKERLQKETEGREEAEKKSHREFNDVTSTLGKKISKLEDTMTAQATDLNEQLLSQSKNITADMDSKFEKSAKDSKESLRELNDIKADRSMLAELFMQFALQFSSEHVDELPAQKSK